MEEVHVDAVLGWIHTYVDDAVPKPSCVEIMMLGMRSELTQEDWERVLLPSGLYCALKRKNIYSITADNLELLARFIFALELLKRERVDSVIAKLPRELKPQSPFDPTKQSRKFQFNQCLVRVCIGLRDTNKQKLINYCSHMCDMTARNFKTVRSLMLKLLERDEINEEDQTKLAQGLVAVHEYDCFRMIQKYRKDNDLRIPPMDLELTKAEVDLTIQNHPGIISESEGTDNVSHQPLVPTAYDKEASAESQQKNANLEDRSGTPDSMGNSQFGPTTTNPSVQGGRRRTADSHRGRARSDLIFGRPWQRRSHTQNSNRKVTLCCGITACVIASMLVAFVGAFAGLTTFSAYFVNRNRILDYHDNSVVILSEVNHFFTKHMVAHRSDDNTHKIDLYRFEDNCNNVPQMANGTFFDQSSLNLSDLNFTVFYLLPGSRIDLEICIDANSTTNLQIILLDKPELVQNFNHQRDLKKAFDHVNFTFNSSNCKSHQRTILRRNYYVLLFYTHSSYNLHNYNYSLVVEGPSINLTSPSLSKRTLYGNLSYSFPFSSDKSCIVAEIKNGTVDKRFGHLGLNFEPFIIWVAHTGFGVSGGLLFTLCIALLVFVCVYRRLRKSGNSYHRVPSNR